MTDQPRPFDAPAWFVDELQAAGVLDLAGDEAVTALRALAEAEQIIEDAR